jgi:uncharacterized protein DUF6335
MAKSKASRRGTSKTAAKRSAKKTGRPRSAQATKRVSARGPKNARKAAKPKSKPAGRAKTAKPAKAAKTAVKRAPARAAKASKTTRATAPKRPNLDRKRRTVAESEMVPTPPSSLNMDRSASAARSGRADMAGKLREHTSTGPAMTGGDVDADWESAESVGDEAPGGDNPTPDQDVVDDIGKALGVTYDDDEELQGGDEIVERDKKRWELDPASSDDFDDRE